MNHISTAARRRNAYVLAWTVLSSLAGCTDDDGGGSGAAGAGGSTGTATTTTTASGSGDAASTGSAWSSTASSGGDDPIAATSTGSDAAGGGGAGSGDAGGGPGSGSGTAGGASSAGGGGAGAGASPCAGLAIDGLSPGSSIYLDTWTGGGTRPVLSGNGRRVAFSSDALDIDAASVSGVPYVPNGARQIFVLDLASQEVTIVSVDGEGTASSDDCEVNEDALDRTGDVVVFQCEGDDLVPNDTGRTDVFAHVLVDVGPWPAGSTVRVSRAAGSDDSAGGATANGDSTVASVAADAPVVVFGSTATNLVVGTSPSGRQSYLHDLVTGTTALASSNAAGDPANATCATPSVSATADWVAFPSAASNLAEPGPFDDSEDYLVLWHLFLREPANGDVTQVDQAADANGFEASGAACAIPITCGSFSPSLSGDGSRVVYDAAAANLALGADDDEDVDVYMFDRETGATRLLSGGVGDGASDSPEISLDGRLVVFRSAEAFDGIDEPGHFTVVTEAPGATPTRVSWLPDGTPAAVSINTSQDMPNLSGDGSLVTFDSRSPGEASRLVLRCLD